MVRVVRQWSGRAQPRCVLCDDDLRGHAFDPNLERSNPFKAISDMLHLLINNLFQAQKPV